MTKEDRTHVSVEGGFLAFWRCNDDATEPPCPCEEKPLDTTSLVIHTKPELEGCKSHINYHRECLPPELEAAGFHLRLLETNV